MNKAEAKANDAEAKANEAEAKANIEKSIILWEFRIGDHRPPYLKLVLKLSNSPNI